jgi:DNA-binding LytR/AlgR family response regulator
MTQSGPEPSEAQGLRGRRILIVEDEFVIAQDLAGYFAQLGAEIVGPAGSLAQAFVLSAGADAAVLDINLRGEMVFPLAEALLERNVPFVFFTAYAAIGVPPHLRRVERFLKPASYARVERTLRRRLDTPEEGEDDELVRLLPKLRIAARLIVRDAAAGDRLVERALERAVEALPGRDRSISLETWIVSIMRATADRDNRRSMT